MRSSAAIWILFLTICLIVGNHCIETKISENSVKSYNEPSSISVLLEGISTQGTVNAGEYQYFKYTFGYSNSISTGENDSINLAGVSSSVSTGISTDALGPQGQSERSVLSSESAVTVDPYDPNDPFKNSISMDLQALTGDPDIYVSCRLEVSGDTYLTPSNSPGHSNFSSQHYDADVLVIAANNPLNCARSGNSGVFYIAVYGSSSGATQFILTVAIYQGVRTLVAGQTVYGSVLTGVGSWFRFQLPDTSAQQLSIVMTPMTGDADLYVKLGKVSTAAVSSEGPGSPLEILSIGASAGSVKDSVGTDGPYIPAQRDVYDYKSTHTGQAQESITIPESSMAECAASSCWVSILVDGYSSATFSLLLTLHDSEVQLSDTVPQFSSVAKGGVQYFSLPISAAGVVSAVVTVLSGRPTIYLSALPLQPDARTVRSAVQDDGSFTGGIPAVSLNVTSGQKVYLAVGDAGFDSAFSIRASLQRDRSSDHTEPPILIFKLLDGVPQNDVIEFVSATDAHSNAHSRWRYYIFPVNAGHETLLVRPLTLVGQVALYINKCASQHPGECGGAALPNTTHHLYTNKGAARSDIDVLRQDDAPCSYVLGVHILDSYEHYVAYQLSVTLADNILELVSGVSVTDQVGKGGRDFFSFLPRFDSSIIIALDTLSGDADLYVSTTNTRPSAANSTWHGSGYGSDFITINPTDPSACSGDQQNCRYYIAVEGFRDSYYTLTASYGDGGRHILDGVPDIGYGEDSYSFVYTYGQRGSITLDFTPFSDSRDFVAYVTLDNYPPSADYHQYVLSGYSQDYIVIKSTDSAFSPCADGRCVVRIKTAGSIMFYITLTTSFTPRYLGWYSTIRGELQALEEVTFRSVVIAGGMFTSVIDTVMIFLTGHVTAYATCTPSMMGPGPGPSKWPNSSYYNFTVTSLGNGELYIPINQCVTSPATGGASLLLTLHADVATSYSVQLDALMNQSFAGFPTLMTPGKADRGLVRDRQFKYFIVVPSSRGTDISVVATVLNGDVDLYISDTYAHKPVLGPDSRVVSFNFSSTGVGLQGESITITAAKVDELCSTRIYDCYFVVGVFGTTRMQGGEKALTLNSPSPHGTSAFTLVHSYKAGITDLVDGMPVSGHCDFNSAKYYTFKMTQPNTDLVLIVTPVFGDPDLYVSLAPVTAPSRTNYTWIAASFGGDTLTLPASDLARHCVPDPSTGKICMLYIGVLAYMNSTYTLLAMLDRGFESRVSLLDGQPQSGAVMQGRYTYYEYHIGSMGTWPLRFTLTPRDGSDLDLFLTFKNASSTGKTVNDNNVPGLSHNDFSSVNAGSHGEDIEIPPSNPHYCSDCTVYLAVLAWHTVTADVKAQYTIVASSGGLEALSQGRASAGAVDKHLYRYYTFHNDDSLARISITLSMASGDADLCVSTYKPGSSLALAPPGQGTERGEAGVGMEVTGELVLPTMQDFMWRSLHFGDDSVEISYDDPNFCYHCEYVLGVYGYLNSTYSLLATTANDAVVQLLPGRAFEVGSEYGVVKYFSLPALNSAATVLFTVTPLDSTPEEIYVKVRHNLTTFLDPDKPNTYDFTTKGTNLNFIRVPGPHSIDTTFLVAVKSLNTPGPRSLEEKEEMEAMRMGVTGALASGEGGTGLEGRGAVQTISLNRYTILASYAQQHIQLVAGVPQSHFVSKGDTETFKFIPTRDADLRISVTARSGDPDLLVSQDFPSPHCGTSSLTKSVGGISSCSNYTWASTEYSSDQIIISRDLPCQASLSSTVISKTCDPATSYLPSTGKPINIGVYGYYKNTVFSIVVSHVGDLLTILPGTPMLSTATSAYDCSDRDQDSGVCLSSSRITKRVLAGYFGFRVAQGQGGDVRFTVTPTCHINTTSPALTCPPGCNCDPLTVFISSCTLDNCTATDRRPSNLTGQSGASFSVSQTGSSVFLSASNPSPRAKGRGGGTGARPGYCDASTAVCMYYIAVSQPYSPSALPPQFRISAQTSDGLTLVQCEGPGQGTKDGIRIVGVEQVHKTSSMYYEVCPSSLQNSGLSLEMSVEQCSGSTSLYACDVDPLTGASHCASNLPTEADWAYRLSGNVNCTRKWGGQGWGREECYLNPYGPGSLLLPYSDATDENNYFLRASGEGDYVMKVQDGRGLAYSLVQEAPVGTGGMVTVKGGSVSSSFVSVSGPLVLSWLPSIVVIPGSQQKSNSDFVTYKAHIVDLDGAGSALNARLDTLCGLDKAFTTAPPGSLYNLTASASDISSFSIRNVPLNRPLSITIVATCTGFCLQNANRQSGACKDNQYDCKTVSFVYKPVTVVVVVPPGSRSFFGEMVIFTFWVVVTALLFMFVVAVKLLHDRGLIAESLGFGAGDSSASSSTPYVDNLGAGDSGGRWKGWGYSQLGFTEMVDTSTFGSSRGQGSSAGEEGRVGQGGGGQGVRQPSTRDNIAAQGRRLLETLGESAATVAAGALTLSRTAGGAISDTTSAFFSRYEIVRNREGGDADRDVDRSTHPLTEGRDSSSSYRPPSPILAKPQGIPPPSISMTILGQTDSIPAAPSYTSFPGQRTLDDVGDSRGEGEYEEGESEPSL